MQYEVVIDGAPFTEGPVWVGDDILVITHLLPGCLRRIDVAKGSSETFAHVPGGANAAQPASDGGFVVAQNSGIDFASIAEPLGIDPVMVPEVVRGTPGLQRVDAEGFVTYLADEGFNAPNDLIVDSDGSIIFTDPPLIGHRLPSASDPKIGRLWRYHSERGLSLVADGFAFDNGVALSPEGRILIVESSGLMWIEPDGGKEWLCEKTPGGGGDGFCFDTAGRIYVAQPGSQTISVLDPDGSQVDCFDTGGGIVTNVCFGGDDSRTLFTTELAPGRVLAFEGLPDPGLPIHRWPVPE
ncbi:SMP-30/gluconolactonase/LRE family protein [Myxococcota bacterium]|nr:SMP-30/gluconolactonase/LRE family protein [Myxococcota bacterium]